MSAMPRSRGSSTSVCAEPSLGVFYESVADSAEVVPAKLGDHPLVYQLLLAAGQAPSRDEFQAGLEDPHYQPADRLLVKRGSRIVAHLLVTRQAMKYGQVELPVAHLKGLATLPEYRSRGYARRLLAAAHDRIQRDGAALAILETKTPEFFHSGGWVACGAPSHFYAGAREILAHLSTLAVHRRASLISTRMWRRVELGSLVQLYDQNTLGAYGPLQRTEAYWKWLISREGFDHILVAIEGDDTLEFGARAPLIVGYAVIKQHEIVELMTEGGHPTAAVQLLTRACREAIERDLHTLWVHGRPQSLLGDLLIAAGAAACEGPGESGQVTMVKVLEPSKLVQRLGPEFQERAKAAGVSSPCEFRFNVDGHGYLFALGRRGAKLASHNAGRWDLSCNRGQFTQLLLSQLDLPAALAAGKLKVRSKSVLAALDGLFPHRPLWRPPFDDTPA